MPRLRAVILDIDGTLLESNDAHAQAFVDAARELEIPADYQQIRRLIGKGGDKLIPEAFGFEQESERGEALDRRKGEIFRERHLPRLQPTPGARALVERLREEGLKRVVATSASKEDLEGLLERAGIADLIDDATSAGDVDETKPAPEPVQAALEQAGCAAEEVVMLGDTPYDVESARRAGVRIVGVRCGGWSEAELRGAAAVYDDPADLLRSFRDSPLAPDPDSTR